MTLPASGWTTTPKLGLHVPLEDGTTDPADWSAIAYQFGLDVENIFFLIADSHNQADLASAYPVGFTLMRITSNGASNGGWPAGGTLLTMRRDDGSQTQQLLFVSGANTSAISWRNAATGAWSAWYQVAGVASPVAVRSGTYTFANVTAPRSVTIAFPAGRFTVAPQISVATHNAGVYANVNSVTASGFTLVLSAFDGGNTIPSGTYLVDWTAMQTDGSGS